MTILWELSNGDVWQLDPPLADGRYRITNVTAGGSLVAPAATLPAARLLVERYMRETVVAEVEC